LYEEVTEIRPLNLDEGEVIDVEELELELANEIFEIRDYEGTHPAFVESWARNPPVKAPFKKVDMARSQRGEYLLPGYTVELRDGRFLEIATIVENIETKVVNLRGWELKRTKDFGGELKFKYNEVCYIFEVDLDDSRPMREQSVIEIGLNRVKKIRNLVRTNYHFPAYRFNIDELPEGTQQEIQRYVESKGVLVARWQYITTFRTAKDRNQQAKYSANYQSRKFVRLDEKECDDNRYLPLYALRYQWSGDALSTNLGQPSTTTRSEGARDARTHAVQACPNSYTDIICIDDSDDEANIQGRKAQNSTTTPVLIHVTSSDFMNVDPWTFMGNIRRRFDARASLGVNDIRSTGRAEEPSRFSALKASAQQGDMRNGNQTKTCLNTKATDGHQYSYADACEYCIKPVN
jgi:DNA (cytosine-5)-methyltransferase 1